MQQYFFHSWLILFFLSYKPDSEGEKVHLNQAVRVRRYTIGGNSHTVRTLPGYVLVWGGDGEGGMLFFPVCGVIPTCCSFLHSALFPYVYSFPTCAIYSHRTIHAIVPFMPLYHLCLAPFPHVLGPREVKDACVALPVIWGKSTQKKLFNFFLNR